MESIKETELNLQREQVTTVGNTWLVKAVNPSTGEEKMIDVSNFSSVVADNFNTSTLTELALRLPVKFRTQTYTLASGEEIDLGYSANGLHYVFNSSSGGTFLATTGSGMLVDENVVYMSKTGLSTVSGSGMVVFNRKTSNGRFFLANERDISQTVRVMSITYY